MSDTFSTAATYRAPITVTDRGGDPFDFEESDIRYAVTTRLGGGETLFEADRGDDAITVEPDGEAGVVRVEIAASELTWTGTVFEELRVSRGATSTVVLQRSVTFGESATA